jgi:hypothetical protein
VVVEAVVVDVVEELEVEEEEEEEELEVVGVVVTVTVVVGPVSVVVSVVVSVFVGIVYVTVLHAVVPVTVATAVPSTPIVWSGVVAHAVLVPVVSPAAKATAVPRPRISAMTLRMTRRRASGALEKYTGNLPVRVSYKLRGSDSRYNGVTPAFSSDRTYPIVYSKDRSPACPNIGAMQYDRS